MHFRSAFALQAAVAAGVLVLLGALGAARPRTLSAQQAAVRARTDVSLLHAGVDTLEVFVVHGEQRERTGLIVDEISFEDVRGERLVRRVHRAQDRLMGSRLDTIVDAASSLLPRSFRSVGGRAIQTLDWDGQRVRGALRASGVPDQPVDSLLDGRVYDGASFDLILRASPLAEGFVLELPCYIAGRGVRPMRAEVAGSEPIEGVGDAWRVSGDFGGIPVTFWIAKRSRRLVRQTMRIAHDVELRYELPVGRAS